MQLIHQTIVEFIIVESTGTPVCGRALLIAPCVLRRIHRNLVREWIPLARRTTHNVVPNVKSTCFDMRSTESRDPLEIEICLILRWECRWIRSSSFALCSYSNRVPPSLPRWRLKDFPLPRNSLGKGFREFSTGGIWREQWNFPFPNNFKHPDIRMHLESHLCHKSRSFLVLTIIINN